MTTKPIVWMVIALIALGVSGYGLRNQAPVAGLLAKFGIASSAAVPATSGQPAAKPAAGAAAGRGKAPVEVAKVQTASLSFDVTAIGTLLPQETVSIAPETSGRIAEVNVTDGGTVAKGAVLFQLDTELAKAAVAEAKARLALAQSNFDRNQTLRKSGNVAQSTYDASVAELGVAQAALDVAEVQLAKTAIIAPFDGTAGFRTVSQGAYVTAGTALVQVDKIDHLYVSFSVPELEQSRIAVGQRVQFTADALAGKVFEATVSGIEPGIDVAGRALKVRADVDNTKLELRPGLLVRITVKGQERQAVVVPEAAIVRRGEDAFVYSVAEDKSKQTKVTLGQRMTGSVEIVDGVAAGTDIVIAGNARLADGAAVDVVPSPPAVE